MAQIIKDASTTQTVLQVNGDSLTTGSVLVVYSNSSSNGYKFLFDSINDHTSAVESFCYHSRQDAQNYNMYLESPGTTTRDCVYIDGPALTTGSIMQLNCASSSASTRSILKVVQNNASATGATPLECTTNAVTSTNFKKAALFNGIQLWTSNGTSPNGALTGTAGDICLNGDSGKPYYCTGTTSWTAFV